MWPNQLFLLLSYVLYERVPYDQMHIAIMFWGSILTHFFLENRSYKLTKFVIQFLLVITENNWTFPLSFDLNVVATWSNWISSKMPNKRSVVQNCAQNRHLKIYLGFSDNWIIIVEVSLHARVGECQSIFYSVYYADLPNRSSEEIRKYKQLIFQFFVSLQSCTKQPDYWNISFRPSLDTLKSDNNAILMG